jgi:aspartate-semialdehyde dehydrogenase
MPRGPEQPGRVAIVGASSLRGKELKQVLEDRNFPAADIILLDESVAAGTLTEVAGEPAFIRALDEDSFEGARFVFFAGSAADAERNWPTAVRAGATVIDMTGAAAASGRVTAWIPSLSSVLLPKHGPASDAKTAAAVYSSPGPGTVIACTLAAGLEKLSAQRITLLMFPPVSERGQLGVEELETQTTNLLIFREISKAVFDEQVAFNLLSAYGVESKLSLKATRDTVVRETAQYLDGRMAAPAIQLLQAPVFYGYAFTAYAEFVAPMDARAFAPAFANLGVKIADAGDPAPTNVSVAGESEIQLSIAGPDSDTAAGVWLWGVADNLRLAAVNAVRIAEELLAPTAIQ